MLLIDYNLSLNFYLASSLYYSYDILLFYTFIDLAYVEILSSRFKLVSVFNRLSDPFGVIELFDFISSFISSKLA